MRRRTLRRLAPLVAAVALGGPLALGPGPAGVRACDPVPVPFQRIVERAEQVFLVTVARRGMAGAVPESYTLVVREALRGEMPEDVTLPITVSIAAPIVNGCGDVLDMGINSHLVIALDVPAFDGAAPISVPWRLRPDGSLEGGHDDGPSTWADLDALRAALAGQAFETPAPTRSPVTVPVDPGAPLASIGIVAGILLGIVAGAAVVMSGRRAARSRRPPPPAT